MNNNQSTHSQFATKTADAGLVLYFCPCNIYSLSLCNNIFFSTCSHILRHIYINSAYSGQRILNSRRDGSWMQTIKRVGMIKEDRIGMEVDDLL